ncbi:MAG: hypothetical protein FGM54_10775 [Chitinophagaceae bacterium]|nr:hypothetical protein [Chitinophagaceae bacterium]
MYSFNQLKYALNIVQDELIEHHFYDEALSKIDVIWIPYHTCYGFQNYHDKGEIIIPGISRSKFIELFSVSYVSLKDILRHEFAHAFAFTHQKLIKNKLFKEAYGTFHDDDETAWEFDERFFVSEYAATSAMEDFAETFMYFLEYNGKLPKKFNKPFIKRKWQFIQWLSKSMK